MAPKPDDYFWQPPGLYVTVLLKESAIQQFQTLRRTEGFLSGHKGSRDGNSVIVIENAAPAGVASSNAIGFYRADSNIDELSAEDRNRLAALPGSAGVFLLMDDRGRAARLFFYYDGRVTRDSQEVSFVGTAGRKSGTSTFRWMAAGVTALVLAVAGFLWHSLDRPDMPPAVERSSPVAATEPVVKPEPARVDHSAKPSPIPPPQQAASHAVRTPAPAPPVVVAKRVAPARHRSPFSAPARFAKWLFRSHKIS